MRVILDAGVDLYVKRAWYENCDFWTPKTWKQFIQPILSSDAMLAHGSGAKFGYLITSNVMPLIDMIIEAGVDVLIGVDPQTYNLSVLAEETKGKICLWGGVNGHLTVERGTQEEVTQEVHRSMEILAPNKGFILSPVDNVREYDDAIQKNVQTLIRQWKISLR
jgi:uroporphyrinogen-III decarboxylase